MKLPAIHQPLLSLIAGILILIEPGLLNLIVAVYLIVVSLLGIICYTIIRFLSEKSINFFKLVRIQETNLTNGFAL